MKYDIYTDGGCWGNPGPGAWAALLRYDGGKEETLTGFEAVSTNNRMELRAVLAALSRVVQLQGDADRGFECTVNTDSQYVQKGISTWIHSWMKNGWKTASKEPVKNKDLWEALWVLNQKVRPTWAWLKGHAGHPENEACDSLVQETLRKHTADPAAGSGISG